MTKPLSAVRTLSLLILIHIQGRLDSPRRRTRICVVGQAGRADNEKTKVVARRLALISNTVQASVASARICGSQACALRHGRCNLAFPSCSAQLTQYRQSVRAPDRPRVQSGAQLPLADLPLPYQPTQLSKLRQQIIATSCPRSSS